MSNSQLIQKLKKLISENNTADVIEHLLAIAQNLGDTDYENHLIIQASFLSEIVEKELNGLDSNESIRIQKAKLKKSLLYDINQLSEFEKIDYNFSVKTKKQEPMNHQELFTQKRVENLNKQLTDLYKLLDEYENDLFLENDPKRKMKIEREIESLKLQITQVEKNLKAVDSDTSLHKSGNKMGKVKKEIENKKMTVLEKIEKLLLINTLSIDDREELENQKNIWIDTESREKRSRITFDAAKVTRANITATVNEIYFKYL